MTTGVSRDLRHVRAHPCPVCQGYDEAPRGQQKRCNGFTSGDGLWTRCSREEHAGGLSCDDAGLYRHMMRGECRCGLSHGPPLTTDPEATYDYRDETGALLFQVVRMPGKQFRQRKPDGAGGWEWKVSGVRRVLYRLPELLAADASATVYVVEGEKDVETLRRRGLVATCNAGGAGKWKHTDAKALEGRSVVVIADADEVGRKHAAEVAKATRGIALECPAAKDITDHLAGGGKLSELVPLRIAAADAAKAPLRLVPPSGPVWGDDEGPPPDPNAKPTILLGTDVHRVLSELDRYLGQLDPLLYQRAHELVTIAGAVAKSNLTPGTPIVRSHSPSALLPRCTEFIRWQAAKQPSARAVASASQMGQEARVTYSSAQPGKALLECFAAQPDWHHVRHLVGVSESPIFRPDGSVRQEAGYDDATGYLYIPACAYPAVPLEPTQADAKAAMGALVDLFCDFPYVSEADRYVPISAILSVIARAAIDGPVPGHLFDATVMGSGKTLQCDVVHVIAVGRLPAHATWPAKEEDQEKLLSTYACASPAAIVLDNVKGIFGGAAIEQTLTSTSVEFRMLGGLELRSHPWRSIVMVSGNNISPSEDMIRRTLLSRLESPLEDPTTRARESFKYELPDDAIALRPQLVVHALTILRAYACKGFPDTGAYLASYKSWAKLVAGAILFSGGADVTKAQPPRERAALDDAGAVATLAALLPRLSPEPMTVKAILSRLYPPPARDEPPDGFDDLREAIEALSPTRGSVAPAAKSVAQRLSKYRGRWFGTRRLCSRTEPHSCVTVWWSESR